MVKKGENERGDGNGAGNEKLHIEKKKGWCCG